MRFNSHQPRKTHKFLNILIQMKNNGLSDYTIDNVNRLLSILDNNTNLDNPEEVKSFIANKQTSNSYKEKLCWAYNKYVKYFKLTWVYPKYKAESRPIRVPTTEQLDTLISCAGRRTTTLKLTLSKETGLRPIELMNLRRKDIDLQKSVIYPTTAKKGNSRILKISNKLKAQLTQHISTYDFNPDDKLFKGSPHSYGKQYRIYRNKLAKKLNRQDLKTVKLYDFRHYFATRLYAKTKDILLVKQQLGHRRMDNTLVYTHLVTLNEGEEYICKATNDKEEAMQLIENGFRFEADVDGYQLFRKRK